MASPNLEIALDEDSRRFHPGEEIRGTVSWELDKLPRKIEVRLFWYTRGKADQDVGVVETLPIEPQYASGRQAFRFRLPDSYYSFSGKHISLIWAIELVVFPGARAERVELVVGPNAAEIVLPHAPDKP